eukprot:12129-Pleurochrysis_carterae.AAC.1
MTINKPGGRGKRKIEAGEPDSGGVPLWRGTRRRPVCLREQPVDREQPADAGKHTWKGRQLTERRMVRLALAESFSESVT